MSKPVYPCCEHGFCTMFDEAVDHEVPCAESGCPGGRPKR